MSLETRSGTYLHFVVYGTFENKVLPRFNQSVMAESLNPFRQWDVVVHLFL